MKTETPVGFTVITVTENLCGVILTENGDCQREESEFGEVGK